MPKLVLYSEETHPRLEHEAKFRILVCGWTRPYLSIHNGIERIKHKGDNEIGKFESIFKEILRERLRGSGILPQEVQVITSGHKGAESMAESFALLHDFQTMVLWPNHWNDGEKAVSKSRIRAVTKKLDLVLCFWDGKDKDIQAVFNKSAKKGIDTRVYINYEKVIG